MSTPPITQNATAETTIEAEAEPRSYGGYAGKVRRFALTVFRPVETRRLLSLREGECDRCGRCCRIGYVCPMLQEMEDGSSRCRAYGVRPPNCRKFPITARDLDDVEGRCSFSFRAEPALAATGGGR